MKQLLVNLGKQNQEVMLHETAEAWVRRRETVTQTQEPWHETVEEYITVTKVSLKVYVFTFMTVVLL